MKKLLLVLCLLGLTTQGPLGAMEGEGRREGGGSFASLLLYICTFGCLFPFAKADNECDSTDTEKWSFINGLSDVAKEMGGQDLLRLYIETRRDCFVSCHKSHSCSRECRARQSDFLHDMDEVLKSRLEEGDCIGEDYDWENSCLEEDCVYPRSEDRCEIYKFLRAIKEGAAQFVSRRDCSEDGACESITYDETS